MAMPMLGNFIPTITIRVMPIGIILTIKLLVGSLMVLKAQSWVLIMPTSSCHISYHI